MVCPIRGKYDGGRAAPCLQRVHASAYRALYLSERIWGCIPASRSTPVKNRLIFLKSFYDIHC
jgi:hypothetical protein